MFKILNKNDCLTVCSFQSWFARLEISFLMYNWLSMTFPFDSLDLVSNFNSQKDSK